MDVVLRVKELSHPLTFQSNNKVLFPCHVILERQLYNVPVAPWQPEDHFEIPQHVGGLTHSQCHIILNSI